MELKDQIKLFAQEKEMTMKEVAQKSNMNYTGLMDKFRRQSITVTDLHKLLAVLGKEMIFQDKK